MRRRWTAWVLLGVTSVSALGREGTLRTTGGEVLSGAVQIAESGLIVRPESGDPVPVSLEALAQLKFADPPPKASQPESSAAKPPVSEVRLPAGNDQWAGIPVGTDRPGQVTGEGGAWVVTGSGEGLRGNGDSCFMAQQPMEVSGQILAKLESFDGTEAESAAGLILRDNLGEAAAYAFVGLRSNSGICFQYRQIASGMTMRVTNVVQDLPAWLRLSRVGGAVVAEVSGDGRQWAMLGRANVNLGRSVRAGMAVASGNPETQVTARFRNPVIGARGLGYVPESGYPRLLFRGGSVLLSPIQSADESVLRLGGPWNGALVSVLNLARIEFVPLTTDLAPRLEPGRVGVLLVDGDFLDGSLRRFTTNTVVMSSLLFGFRPFAAGSEAGVVQLADVEPEEHSFVVRLWDGSELLARRLTCEADALRVESPLLGSLAVKVDQVASVQRGSGER